MEAQIVYIHFCRKIDYYTTAYIFANATNFTERQTLKCGPHTPHKPSVLVCELSSKWWRNPEIQMVLGVNVHAFLGFSHVYFVLLS
jgi:hypothetical protein